MTPSSCFHLINVVYFLLPPPGGAACRPGRDAAGSMCGLPADTAAPAGARTELHADLPTVDSHRHR